MHYHRSAFKLIPNVTIKEYMNSLLQRNHTLPCIAMKLNKLQFKLHMSAGLITECLVKVSFASSSQQGFLFFSKVSFQVAAAACCCLVFNKQLSELQNIFWHFATLAAANTKSWETLPPGTSSLVLRISGTHLHPSLKTHIFSQNTPN